MPNPDMPPIGATEEEDRARSDCPAVSVAQDFAALAEILDRQLQLLSSSDEETRSHIARLKEAAERGVRLSQQLIERMQSRD